MCIFCSSMYLYLSVSQLFVPLTNFDAIYYICLIFINIFRILIQIQI